MSLALIAALAAAAPIAATPADIIPLPLQPVVPAAQRTCAATTPTGLGIKLLRPGTGPSPSADDIVLVNYIGYLAATGAVFDQGMQEPLPASEVIPGFTQGLLTLKKGAISRFCIPPALGYKDQATGPIPANSNLVFQVELLEFKTRAEVQAMQAAAAAPGQPRPVPAAPPKP